ncbi:MAG: YbbR-like domain-containing protein [Anaerorhabdus sp.]
MKKKKNNSIKDPNAKLELAHKISNQKEKVASTYAYVEEFVFWVLNGISSWMDRVLFNSKYTIFVSLILAVLMYLTVNYNAQNSIFGSAMVSAKDVTGVSVSAKYNEDVFEISNLPASANITITGEGSNVNTAASQRGVVVANLEGLTEGTHQVKLVAEGYGDNVNVKVDPSIVVVTLSKKTTGQFDVGYDFINQDKMNNIYSLGTPTFDYSRVNVRGSKSTLESIAFIKALIDVTGVSADFEQEAVLVAYDNKGQAVSADIVPGTINVSVSVTSPNKTVPITVESVGAMPEGLAIESIQMDHESVTIYAPESVLSKIDSVVVTLDATTLTKDSTVSRAITLPAGVRQSSISQVTMDVTLGEGITKVVKGVPILVKNNVNKYTIAPLNNQTSVDVEVFGTESNINKINTANMEVYFDMANAILGDQEFPLIIEQPFGTFVKYSLPQGVILVNVSGTAEDGQE